MLTLAFLNNLFGFDGLVLLVLALLIFGRRLPQVGRHLEQTVIDFKKAVGGGRVRTRSEEEILLLAIIVLVTLAAIVLLSRWVH